MQSGKAHINYQVNKKKITNTKKMQEAIKATVALLKRGAKEGLTAWVKNAIKTAASRMKKYNVTMESIEKEAGVKIKDLKPVEKAKKKIVITKKGEGASKKEAKKAAPKKAAAKAPAKKVAAKPAEKKAAAPKKAPAKKAPAKKAK